MRDIVIHPGQRIITNGGNVVTVALVNDGVVWVYYNNTIVPVEVIGDAWGGEYDQSIGLAAQAC